MRREFSSKTKAEAFIRASGCCEECASSVKLRTGDIFYDHRIPDALGGAPTIDNCQVLCRRHHDAKTRSEDVPRIAKAKRVRNKHIGIRSKSKFACSRNSKFKKRLDGTVVLRGA